MAKKEPYLNKKEQIFVNEYLRDRNATRAAVAAGYAEKTAAQAGSRLLRFVKVREEINRLTSKHLSDLEITAKKVLQGIAQLAFYDPRRLFNDDGTLKRIVDMDELSAMALKGIDVESTVTSRHTEDGEVTEATKETKDQEPAEPAKVVTEVRTIVSKIRLADRGENLERLGRHLKLFTDRLELEDVTPYDPERDGERIAQLLVQAVRSAAAPARP
jgi:phage terminase small subunit